jgi:hypothetical protein
MITNDGKDVEERKPFYTIGGNSKLEQPFWKIGCSFLKKKKKP